MIELEQVSRTFVVGGQSVHALDRIDLTIEDGEYLSVMGPSGSGKSTLLNVIGLLDRISSGRYRLGGRDVTTLDDAAQARVRREQIGFVFQFYHLVPRLTAAQNIELPLTLAGVASGERRRRVDDALQTLNLGERAHHRPDQLSGGQRQRVAIGRAMIMRPAIILADEPTGNLDRASGRDVVDALESLNRDRGLTLVVVTHDAEMGERAPRRVQMIDGRIAGDVQSGAQ